MSQLPVIDAAWRTRNVGYLLFAATNRCVREKLRLVHRNGFGAITEAQMALFQNLDLDGTRLTTIAARANLTKQSMIELVDKAEALALVERWPDPEDKRAKIVRFTPHGHLLLDALRQGIAEAEDGVARIVSEPFVGELKRELGAYAALPVTGDTATPDMPGAHDGVAWRTDNVGRAFALAARRFVREVVTIVRARGHDEVTEVLLALFRNLELGGTRLTDLAARARITKQSMRELVDRAEALGLVERRPDPADRRAKTILFTSAGLALLEEMRRGVAEAEAHFAQITGGVFLTRLKDALTAYNAATEAGSPVAAAA